MTFFDDFDPRLRCRTNWQIDAGNWLVANGTYNSQRAEEAVSYAQAAHVAARLINKSAEELDLLRLYPMLDVLAPFSGRVEEPRVLFVT